MNDPIRALEPRLLWNCFADLNAVPRPSKKEERVKAFVTQFAQKHRLECREDTGGNVIIKKAATPDREGAAPVILQAHLDMVHKAADGVVFDFENQGIEMWIDDGWVRARGTTLGADNGLGVAAILAVLASEDLRHPPLEVLLTTDEEQGMSGALRLQAGMLSGKTLLNLDSEEDDTFTIGCAGGMDTQVAWHYAESQAASGVLMEICVTGLRGGHSGLCIHEGRGNAIKLMARLLSECGEPNAALVEMNGGSARNAIPARCIARVVVHDEAAFAAAFASAANALKGEFQAREPRLEITAQRVTAAVDREVTTLEAGAQRALVQALLAVVDGVYRMSTEVPGLVETSSNLSLIHLGRGRADCFGLQRSNIEPGKHEVAAAFAAPFHRLGAEVRHEGSYPGWRPAADSAILDRMQRIYRRLFDHEVKVSACHAGLECGVIARTYPGLDMISFGPDIEGAHSENERARIASVQKFWTLLTTLLADLT